MIDNYLIKVQNLLIYDQKLNVLLLDYSAFCIVHKNQDGYGGQGIDIVLLFIIILIMNTEKGGRSE